VPPVRVDAPPRSTVAPAGNGRSLWLSAVWTGTGTALVCAVAAIAAVAVCWLPASGGAGNADSTIRAGILTFLAALHGGITVDGVPSAFVPLGLTLVVGLVAWRAGAGLAGTADELGEQRTDRLVRVAGVQAAAFALACAVAAATVSLGTSSVPAGRVAVAGFVLFVLTGGIAFVRGTVLAEAVAERAPRWVGPALRCAAAAIAVYLAAGALLVAGALVVHHDRVQALSSQVGGGWSGAPVLLLGILAAPNAVIAASSYLAGPGFALGTGSAVSLDSTVHGTLPAFPVLGAVPSGPATTPVWLLAAAVPLTAGICVAVLAHRGAGRVARCRDAALGSIGAGVIGGILGWQGGGAIGTGRLSTFGASPGQFGALLAGAVAVTAATGLATAAALGWWRAGRAGEDADQVFVPAALVALASSVADDADADTDAEPGDTADGTDGPGQLAG
jgi:hypothetical protein